MRKADLDKYTLSQIKLHIKGNLSKFVAQKQGIMKSTRLFLIGAFAVGFAVASCGYSNPDKITKEQLYSNATHVDSEGFTFFKTTYEKAAYELSHANYALSQGVSGDAKAIADQIVAAYTDMLPELEELAITKQVIVPDPGALVFTAPEVTAEQDSVAVPFDAEAYVLHVQKEHKELLNQFKRVSRNTDPDLRKFGSDKIAAVKEIFALSGGQEDESAH